MTLSMVVDPCYHIIKKFILVIMIQVYPISIDFLEVVINIIVSIIIVWEYYCIFQCIVDGFWIPLVVRGEHNIGQFIKILIYMLQNRHMHQWIFKVHCNYLVYSMNIMFTSMMLNNIMDSHNKLTGLWCGDEVVGTSI